MDTLAIITGLLLLVIVDSAINKYFSNKKKKAKIEAEDVYTPATSMVNRFGETLNIGDRVLCRSNEPCPLDIGVIVSFWDGKGKFDHQTPVVKMEHDEKEYLIMGICRLYDQELVDKLKTMPDLEQWNYLANEYCQIREKYGVEYKTYR